jgi:hypothetical protein
MVEKNSHPQDSDYAHANITYPHNISKRTAIGLVILLIVTVVSLILISNFDNQVQEAVDSVPAPLIDSDAVPEDLDTKNDIVFEKQEFESNAYNINTEVPIGDSFIVDEARFQLDQLVQDLQQQAIMDREMILAEGGELPNYLRQPYVMDVTSDRVFNQNLAYESVVYLIYQYTGGANGVSYYRVITANNNDLVDNLAEIVPIENRARVKSAVVAALESKSFDGQLGSQVLSPQALQNLGLDEISFSIDNENLIIYLDEYQVGPGVLGSFSTNIALAQIEDLLDL